MRGREEGYASVYWESELKEPAQAVKQINARKKYIYPNNDHGMLPNGKLPMQRVYDTSPLEKERLNLGLENHK